jgi:hypothetical protein
MSDGQSAVVVLSGTERQRIQVTIGLVTDADVEVVSGLQEGQQVLVDPT